MNKEEDVDDASTGVSVFDENALATAPQRLEEPSSSSQFQLIEGRSESKNESVGESLEPSELWLQAHKGENDVDEFDGNYEGGTPPKVKRRKRNLNTHATNQIKISLIGLPSSGKSSLFNILTSEYGHERSAVDHALFTTTDLRIRSYEMPDERLDWLQGVFKSKKRSPQVCTVIDNPAIVAGSHANEGLGNTFLGKSRMADLMVYVLRAFVDEGISHYNEYVDPVRDLIILEQETMVRDLQTLEGVLNEYEKFANRSDNTRERTHELATMIKIWETLTGRKRPAHGEKPETEEERKRGEWKRVCSGTPLRFVPWTLDEVEVINKFDFMTCKEALYVINTSPRDFFRKGENQYSQQIQSYLQVPHPKHGYQEEFTGFNEHGDEIEPPPTYMGEGLVVPISLEFENHLRKLKDAGAHEYEHYLKANPTHRSGLNDLNKAIVKSLNMNVYYTANEVETRAWGLPGGTGILTAARAISADMERLFNYADVMTYDDFIEVKGDINSMREDKKLRPQGKRYVVCDGDIIDVKVKKK